MKTLLIILLLIATTRCNSIEHSNVGVNKFHRKHLNKVYVSCPAYH